MQADLQEALSTKFPDGNFPPWVKPFLSAVHELDQLYKEEEKRLGLIAQRKALAERIGIPMEEITAENEESEDPEHLERAESDLLSVSIGRVVWKLLLTVGLRLSTCLKARKPWSSTGLPRYTSRQKNGRKLELRR